MLRCLRNVTGRSGPSRTFLYQNVSIRQNIFQKTSFTTGTKPCLRSDSKRSKKLKLTPRKGSILTSRATQPYNPGFKKNVDVAEDPLKLFNKELEKFRVGNIVKETSRSIGASVYLLYDIMEKFMDAIEAGEVRILEPQFIEQLKGNPHANEMMERSISLSFYKFAEPYLPESAADELKSTIKLTDLRFPSEWFPEARQIQRKIILHVGPTNSGKTYRALKRLEEAESGIYCGPLRLLANEIYEKMNSKGIPCNLLTGEERRIVSPTAALTSSTVEMANLSKPLEVAVIDEIQLINDQQRGWAWTQALLGLKAREIHLCGEASVVPLIRKIAESLNEEVIVNEYSRLTPIEILDTPVSYDFKDIKKGDCVIAFSRSDIFNIEKHIKKNTNLKCAVVYGALPPETRALQAKKFNDPESGYDVMVASDAIGMGINLNIKRVVFSTVVKFNGVTNTHISIPQLKQIAGRAGRFGTAYSSGEVTAMDSSSLDYIKSSMASSSVDLKVAGLQPTPEILEIFGLQYPNEKFEKILTRFELMASLSGNYFLCNFKDQKIIASAIEGVKLSIRDRYQFVTAPVNTRVPENIILIKALALAFSENRTVTLEEAIKIAKQGKDKELIALEKNHKYIMLYMWLSLRYPDSFITLQDDAMALKKLCEGRIDKSLKRQTDDIDSKKKGKRSNQHNEEKKGSPK